MEQLALERSFKSLIIKIANSLIVIGLKNSHFPLVLAKLLSDSLLSGGQFVIEQFNLKPITSESCSLNQPITFKVVV